MLKKVPAVAAVEAEIVAVVEAEIVVVAAAVEVAEIETAGS